VVRFSSGILDPEYFLIFREYCIKNKYDISSAWFLEDTHQCVGTLSGKTPYKQISSHAGLLLNARSIIEFRKNNLLLRRIAAVDLLPDNLLFPKYRAEHLFLQPDIETEDTFYLIINETGTYQKLTMELPLFNSDMLHFETLNFQVPEQSCNVLTGIFYDNIEFNSRPGETLVNAQYFRYFNLPLK
jgi:hypothetical protein